MTLVSFLLKLLVLLDPFQYYANDLVPYAVYPIVYISSVVFQLASVLLVISVWIELMNNVKKLKEGTFATTKVLFIVITISLLVVFLSVVLILGVGLELWEYCFACEAVAVVFASLCFVLAMVIHYPKFRSVIYNSKSEVIRKLFKYMLVITWLLVLVIFCAVVSAISGIVIGHHSPVYLVLNLVLFYMTNILEYLLCTFIYLFLLGKNSK
eukprot:TRINITY_DN446_c0_g1_i3.p1 TRINITY_DN446_c0_g1~~TRINITY_DN446_c0_g1_i3.p1  ORF type:complete len:211 (-),score=20.85 TRINITY_DN446_c0_g1_i3:89-721(-)